MSSKHSMFVRKSVVTVRDGRIGPQDVRVVAAEQLEIKARHSIKSPKCMCRAQKGRNGSHIERFDYLCALRFSGSVLLLKIQSYLFRAW